jgi:RNA polymerase subunit RPABC4/transcription elongation factor Spt4
MKAEALRCDYCGGFIEPTTYKCPYCGTQYMKPNDSHIVANGQEYHVVAKAAPCWTYGVEKRVPLETLKLMQECGIPVEEEIRREFAQKIAEQISKRLEIYDDFNIDSYEKTYSARLRVVKPDFRF